MRLLACISLLIIFNFFEAKTQPYPSGRISINKGSRISFDFRTLDSFQNGFEKADCIELEIDFKDTDDNNGWELGVQASNFDLAPSFISGSGLPLEIIELSTTPCPFCSPIKLSSGLEIIAEETWPIGGTGAEKIVKQVISLSVYCNQGRVVGNSPIKLQDYVNETYVVELEFTLRRKQ